MGIDGPGWACEYILIRIFTTIYTNLCLAHVHLPKDRVTQDHQGFGFVEFITEVDADYAIRIMNLVKLYGKPIRVNKASADKTNVDIGATLFIGNLSLEVDEKLLYDTFLVFGNISQTPKIARDESTGASKGFGFVSFDDFEASDKAMEQMNGQFLRNQQITVSYAYKKEGKGEKHGSEAGFSFCPDLSRLQITHDLPI